jgi:hypothetical protein
MISNYSFQCGKLSRVYLADFKLQAMAIIEPGMRDMQVEAQALKSLGLLLRSPRGLLALKRQNTETS